jgi:myo-inositol-1(or 4)-monophosphatase
MLALLYTVRATPHRAHGVSPVQLRPGRSSINTKDGGTTVEQALTQPAHTEAPYPDAAMLEAIETAACDLLAQAGRIVMERYGGALRIEYKDKTKTDPVTEIDRAVEAFLTEAVGQRFPGHAVLGEEGQDPAEEAEFLWIVDPVDGTINYINQLPFFAISLGVLHQRRPVVSALLLPVSGELFHARRGGGAFCNGQAVRVHPAPAPSGRIAVALPPGFWFQFRARRAVRRNLGEARSLGSIVYELALTASGGFGYALFRSPKIWDVAGGVTLLREAGGEVMRYSKRQGAWQPLDRFDVPPAPDPEKPRTLRHWSGPILAGAAPLVTALAPGIAPRYTPVALRATLRRYQGWRRKQVTPAPPDNPPA